MSVILKWIVFILCWVLICPCYLVLNIITKYLELIIDTAEGFCDSLRYKG